LRAPEHTHALARDSSGTSSPGGQDGLVNILGTPGVLAGGGGRTILLSTGLAAAITESISMGAVGYTSAIADRDYYTAQRTEEESALVDDADLEGYPKLSLKK
jgi:hypothetical protein